MTLTSRTVLIILIYLVLLPSCSQSERTKEAGEQSFKKHFKQFIPLAALERAGFQHFNPPFYSMVIKGPYFYILNQSDHMIAKFKGSKPLRVYKAAEGQAPKEMINPKSVFFYNQHTIAVFDITKLKVLMFDLDLNYLREEKVTDKFFSMFGSNKGILAFAYWTQGYVFALIDEEFNEFETFVKANKKIPFDRFYPPLLNMGFMLNGNLAAHTYRLQPRKQCKLDVYDINTTKRVITLKWEQPFTPSQGSFNARKNMYFTVYAGRHGSFYVIQNQIIRRMGSKTSELYLLVFDRTGELKRHTRFPHLIMRTQKDNNAPELYFFDDEENLSYVDIGDIVK